MNPPLAEAGTEFVLDNRKLIIAFLLLIIVCGAFFVIGFMEGKRQAVQVSIERVPSAASPGIGDVAAGSNTQASGAGSETAPAEDRSMRAQLDWYKKVKGSDNTSDLKTAPRPEGKKAPASGAQTVKPATPQAPGSMVPAASVTYAVQVGAFRQRREAEAKAETLKERGFTCVIEDPKSADQLYLVKVGKFGSRAEAVAMQLRLKKAGFTCFIKTN